MILIWIALILAFFSLALTLVRAQKTISTLIVRVELLETAISLCERELAERGKDLDVLLSTESLTSTVEESIKSLENEVDDLAQIVGKPQDLSDTLSDRVDEIESQLDLISSKELVEIDDLAIEVIEIIKGLNFTLGLVRR